VVLVAGGTWWAGSKIRTPGQIAADAATPAPAPILVPVEERVLTSDIVTRGTARFGLPQAISIVPSALKGDIGVITTLPAPNTQLNEGDVLLTASERPLFVVQGERPVFRDLVPGISNANDVRQLEDGLLRMGFDPGPIDGTFDEQTSAAVANWYSAAGWEPFGPTAEQLSNIRALEEELADVTNQKLAADEAVTAALLAVEAAQASGDQVEIQTAINEENAAEREANRANDLVARLTADLEQARRQAGVQVPASEIVFIPALPVRVEEIDVAVGDEASGAVMTVTNNQLAIDSSLPIAEASLVMPGMPVAIDEPDLGIKATGVIERVADGPGTDGVDGFHVYFETRVEETPTSLDGFSVRLTIPVKSTGGAVIVVPVSALSLAPDGTSRVQLKHDDDSLEFITVEPGLSADGFVQVTPLQGTLQPGQLVVIGFE
jgi:peptidoglycan hydrolase-like protein with peptidoglycan-binding domain